VLLAVLALLTAACGDDGGDGDSGGGGDGGDAASEDTGEVSVFSAMEPAEADALNAVVDELINADVDYTAEVEASADFEEQSTIRIEGGNPPDVIMYPQPGAVIAQAEAGTAISLEDLGFDITSWRPPLASTSCRSGSTRASTTGCPRTSTSRA